MRYLFISSVLVIFLSGCMTSRKATTWVPSSANSGASVAEASIKCTQEAGTAGANAARTTQASQSKGGGFTAGLANALSIGIARSSARNNAMNFCMRAQGFTKK